jgi:hypothetical protein
MAIQTESRSVVIGGVEYIAEAAMNSCSNVWSGVVRSGSKPIATAAGNSPEEALANAIARAKESATR